MSMRVHGHLWRHWLTELERALSRPDATARAETIAAVLDSLRQELDDVADLILAGQAAIGLTHDLANHLNSMVLQASCIQMKVSQRLREELGLIRQQGAEAAALLRPLQHISKERRQRSGPTDPRPTLAGMFSAEETARFHLDLASDLLLPIPPGDFRRLLREVLSLSAGDVQKRRLATVVRGKNTYLIVELPDVPFPGPTIQDLFSGGIEPDDNRRVLRRLALESLLRQVDASLEVLPRTDGGTILEICWSQTA
jgi:hypothetical protein